MTHIGRTHRISIAWLYEQLQANNIKMYRADSELMAADIFTKPFPDAKASAWRSNLALINITEAALADSIDYHPSMVQSLRGGDLDKPKAVPIDQALLSEDNDVEPPNGDDGNTVCPNDDDRNVQEFDDHYYNDEWEHSHADWTQDFQITAAPCATDIFHECHDSFDSDNARVILAGHTTTPIKSVMCVYATPSVEAKAAADYWEVKGNKLIRHHICPRTKV